MAFDTEMGRDMIVYKYVSEDNFKKYWSSYLGGSFYFIWFPTSSLVTHTDAMQSDKSL